MKLTDEQIAVLDLLARKGSLTAEAFVVAAEPEDSPLHDLLEWDDEVAGAAWREHRARQIIHEVMVRITTTTTTVLVERYVPDPTYGKDGYIRLDRVKDEDTQRAIIRQEVNRALGTMRRAADIAEALGQPNGVHAMIAEWVAWRDELAPPADPESLAAD